MKIVLILVLVLSGQQPITQGKEMPNMKTCEAEAHKYNAVKLPPEAIYAQAACARIDPLRYGKKEEDT